MTTQVIQSSASLIVVKDEDDRCPNLPTATSEECNGNGCNYLLSNHHNFLNLFENLPPPRLSGLHVYGGAMCEVPSKGLCREDLL